MDFFGGWLKHGLTNRLADEPVAKEGVEEPPGQHARGASCRPGVMRFAPHSGTLGDDLRCTCRRNCCFCYPRSPLSPSPAPVGVERHDVAGFHEEGQQPLLWRRQRNACGSVLAPEIQRLGHFGYRPGVPGKDRGRRGAPRRGGGGGGGGGGMRLSSSNPLSHSRP